MRSACLIHLSMGFKSSEQGWGVIDYFNQPRIHGTSFVPSIHDGKLYYLCRNTPYTTVNREQKGVHLDNKICVCQTCQNRIQFLPLPCKPEQKLPTPRYRIFRRSHNNLVKRWMLCFLRSFLYART